MHRHLARLGDALLPLLPLLARATRSTARGKDVLPPMPAARRCALWAHGASYGELHALLPLVRQAMGEEEGEEEGEEGEQRPAVLVTSTSRAAIDSGRVAALQAAHAGRVRSGLLPWDTGELVGAFMRAHAPERLLVGESELWPVALGAVRERQLPALLVNARLSDTAARRWASCAPARLLCADMLASFRCILADEDEADGAMPDRLAALAPTGADVRAAPSSKWLPVRRLPPPPHARPLPASQRPVVTAAVTHDGEEAFVLHALARMPSPAPLLVLAPRHAVRFDAVARLAARAHLRVARMSDAPPSLDDVDVLLVDEMGVMDAVYHMSDVVLVGGALLPRGGVGGHSPIEAVRAGRAAVLTGGNVDDRVAAAWRVLDPHGDARLPRDIGPDALANRLAALVTDDALRADMARVQGDLLAHKSAHANRQLLPVITEFMAT